MLRCIAILWLLLPFPAAASAQDHASAVTHHEQGMALYRGHDPEGAIRELTRAVEIDARYAEAWNDLGARKQWRNFARL